LQEHFAERDSRNIGRLKILQCQVKSNIENEISKVLDWSRGPGVDSPECQLEGLG
jgi:hypothetical protein